MPAGPDFSLNLSAIFTAVSGFIIVFLVNRAVKSSEKKDEDTVRALEAAVARLNEHGQAIAVLRTNTGSLLQLTGEHTQKLATHAAEIAVLKEKTS